MMNQELNVKVAEACGTANQWVLMKCGLYYRPNAHGYTENIQEAWVVSEEEANKHVYPNGDQPVMKHRAPVPDYCADLNLIQSAVLAQSISFIRRFSTALSYRSSRTGRLFCQLMAWDWAEEFINIEV